MSISQREIRKRVEEALARQESDPGRPLTVSALAKEVGVSRAALYRVEEGRLVEEVSSQLRPAAAAVSDRVKELEARLERVAAERTELKGRVAVLAQQVQAESLRADRAEAALASARRPG